MTIDDLPWHKSSYSNGDGGNCVEVAALPDGGTVVRDTKDHGTGPVLRVATAGWAAFLHGVRDGRTG